MSIESPCKSEACVLCGWPLSSVESLQKHYGYHLDRFKVEVEEDSKGSLLINVAVKSSTHEANYTFPSSRLWKPYPQLQQTSKIDSRKLSEKELSKVFSNIESRLSRPNNDGKEPERKRRKEDAREIETEEVFIGLDQFQGDKIGSLYGFQDHLLDLNFMDFVDVDPTDRQFANIWNHYRRRKKMIPEAQTYSAMREFIQLNIYHLRGYRQHLLQHLMTFWQYRRISRDQLLNCMELYDHLVAKYPRVG